MNLWIPVIALVLGSILHSLSDSGGASILDHFNIKWRLPTVFLPIAILGFGVASGTVDAFSAGADWKHALASAAAASLATALGATVQHGMVNKSGLTSLTAVLLLIVFGLQGAVACKPVIGPSNDAEAGVFNPVEAGATVANDVCSFIEGVDDNGAIRTICATVDEVASIVAFVLTLRSIDGGKVDGGADGGACKSLPGTVTTLCATPNERAKGILFLVRVRAARFVIDGGTK